MPRKVILKTISQRIQSLIDNLKPAHHFFRLVKQDFCGPMECLVISCFYMFTVHPQSNADHHQYRHTRCYPDPTEHSLIHKQHCHHTGKRKDDYEGSELPLEKKSDKICRKKRRKLFDLCYIFVRFPAEDFSGIQSRQQKIHLRHLERMTAKIDPGSCSVDTSSY